MNWRTVGVLLCSLLVLLAGGGGATVIASSTGGPADMGAVTDVVDTGADTLTVTPGTQGVSVDDRLRPAEGTLKTLVLFEDRQARSTEAMQAHADTVRQPFETFAETTRGVTVESRLWLTPAALVTVDTDRVGIHRLADIDGVRAIVENARVSAQSGGIDSLAATPASAPSGLAPEQESTAGSVSISGDSYNTTYGLAEINATGVWEEYGTRGAGTSVAVLDTGVDADHPDIDVAKWAEFDSSGNQVNTTPNDGDGHGTHVSGTVLGGNASGAHIGVAPGADLYAAKVLDDSGGGTLAQIIAGMQWAVDRNADIISMSLGAQGYLDSFIDPVRNAQAAGTTVVASSGNAGEGTSGSPGNVHDAISVGASNASAGIAEFSSGEEIQTDSAWNSPPADWPDTYIVPSVAAPGVAVESAWPGNDYRYLDGTSMAAPHVSGAAALVESAVSGDISPAELEAAFEATASKPSDAPAPAGERDTRYGAGIVDVPAAVEYLQSSATLSVALSDTTAPVEGETLSVAVQVENVGTVKGTETVTLSAGTLGETATNVTLAAGATTTVTLTLSTGEGDAGEYTATVTSTSDSDTATVTVDTPATPALSGLDIAGAGDNATLLEGDNATVSVVVENVGDRAGSFDITLALGTARTETQTTGELSAGTLETVTFANVTGNLTEGRYNATVSTAESTVSGAVTVDPTHSLSFTDQNATEQAAATVDAVFSDGQAVLFLTYTNGDNQTVAGVTNGTFNTESVMVALSEYVGFPDEYTAHLVPSTAVNGSYQPGDNLSATTTDETAASASATVTTSTGAPALVIGGNNATAMDTTGDGLLNDVLGTGSFNIFDVQALFNNRDQLTGSGNATYFNFSGGSADEVTIFDVQALFSRSQER